jgi:hypothetical protein
VETLQDRAFFFLLETAYQCESRTVDAFGATPTITGDRLRGDFLFPPPCLAGTFDLRRQ